MMAETYNGVMKECGKTYTILLRIWNGVEEERIEKYFNKLESEMMLMEIDCIEIMGHTYQGFGNSLLFEHCFDACASLDNLVKDLKKIRKNLK